MFALSLRFSTGMAIPQISLCEGASCGLCQRDLRGLRFSSAAKHREILSNDWLLLSKLAKINRSNGEVGKCFSRENSRHGELDRQGNMNLIAKTRFSCKHLQYTP
jgi:hypothetical protein